MIDYRENAKWKVYAHISPSGKMYVGITKQKNPTRRWEHGKGYKHNPHFYRSIQKYGWDNFQHEIIADHLTKSEAVDLEKVLISGLNLCDSGYGYNLTDGGEAGKEGHKSQMKKVYRLDSDWNILEEYESGEEAKRKMGFKENNGSIHKAIIKGTRCKGYYWANDETYPLMKDKKKKQMNAKVLQFNLNGTFMREFVSASDVEKELGYSVSSIRQACNGSIETSHGYFWRYAFQYHGEKIKVSKARTRPIAQFNLDGSFVAKYDSLVEAQKKHGFIPNIIGRCCRGKKKTYKNFYWKFLDECEPQDDGSFLMPKNEEEA